VAQTGYVLSTVKPIRGLVGGVAVVFIGWTESADNTIYAAGDVAPTTISTIDIAVGASTDYTVYAVWGYDTNGNGVPDVLETAYDLTYDLNDGVAGTGPTSPVKVVAQTNYVLSTTKPDHVQVGGFDVLFIGWTTTKDTKIYAAGDVAPTTVTNVSITGDRTVYAVWGYDKDGNGIPDVLDTYSVTVNNSYANANGSGNYNVGDTVTIRAGARNGYTFDGWTVNEGGITIANSQTVTFTMPASNVTVTANWARIEIQEPPRTGGPTIVPTVPPTGPTTLPPTTTTPTPTTTVTITNNPPPTTITTTSIPLPSTVVTTATAPPSTVVTTNIPPTSTVTTTVTQPGGRLEGERTEWAVLNLILAIIGILLALGTAVWVYILRGGRGNFLWFIVAAALAIAGIVIVFITENMNLKVGIANVWTILSAAIFIAESIALALVLKLKGSSH
jgi:uncharacterized repeat protein (TIGR02543 family)